MRPVWPFSFGVPRLAIRTLPPLLDIAGGGLEGGGEEGRPVSPERRPACRLSGDVLLEESRESIEEGCPPAKRLLDVGTPDVRR